ncbi:signal recognition particle subunit Sec65 [Schizosaccharomyces japonicus yFS275]|uniref:Signal recognition particle subunit Sec65 n=1 Tax=Schizosaccharomyces japonicus (strain yFS275 / FY16936) TaxID=402676 RepID=B6K2I5_SCHJY|nr:signal recognition particle subunit Sec65 [Schizosaccharomyces japonicus yFS275]EEB07366.1 signal recognition particle subunit Sec65 [Schizosaccharomyces japonicus yFS275]
MVVLYPIYFDRTRPKGLRRVPKELAIENPLAKNIGDVVYKLGYKCVLNPSKTHPADWANPGRVDVVLPDNMNRRSLYKQVAQQLVLNPTKREDPLRLPVSGLPAKLPEQPPAYPKGMKGNTILPLHSPAVSGGGVSDNMLQDMMQAFQNPGNGGNPLLSLGAPSPASNASSSSPPASSREKSKGKGKKPIQPEDMVMDLDLE